MDPLNLPTGLALFAFVGAVAGTAAWNHRRRRAELRRDVGAAERRPAPTPLPPPAEKAPAHHVAAKAVIEQAQAQARAAAQGAAVGAAAPASAPMAQSDGPAWAPTEPMPEVACEPQFADTMPAEMTFAATNFADTLVAELATDERPSAVPGTCPRPA